MQKNYNFTVSVAPMMDWTDRHCRWFHRKLSKNILLYTEMVVAEAIIYGDKDFLISYNTEEHPVALQLGGSNPQKLSRAAKIGEQFGYDEININIGCPSDRVQSGRFGACLMREPELVADCYAAIKNTVDIPVTVKCRLGVDQQNVSETLPHFIETVSRSGCEHFIIHARKAWLNGLSPKENRSIPPLQYSMVHEIKKQFSNLEIILNGGLKNILDAKNNSIGLDGVMFGRAAYQNPWFLTKVDKSFYEEPVFTEGRDDLVEDLIRYAELKQDSDRSTKSLIRHIMGLYAGQIGARAWRRALSEGISNGLKPSKIIKKAAEEVDKTKNILKVNYDA
ncbi:tRNA dihydrouridine(20/20a) synthase DusA [Hellea sp.]|nr:tRNA dihydrouridine(20/20a) synthase DusA [Hellea sp.]